MLGLRSVSLSLEESGTRKPRQSTGEMRCWGRILLTTCVKPSAYRKEMCVEAV